MDEERQTEDLWKNRRSMAWKAFYGAGTYVFAVLAFMAMANADTVKSATELGTISIAVLGFFGGIVMAYIGASTWAEK